MTAATYPASLHALRRAAVDAVLAPSVHNTQPWRLTLEPDSLEICADRTRQLEHLDPLGRQLMISCGCALFNARVALAATGVVAQIERFPEPERPELLARLTVTEVLHGATSPGPAELAALEPVLGIRRTNRGRFCDDPVPADLVDRLIRAAADEGAVLIPVEDPEQRLALAILSQQADRAQNADPGYRAEIRAWTTQDPDRRDGVPSAAVPHVDGGSRDDVPIRDFDTHGSGSLPVETHSSMQQCLLLLCSSEDSPAAWLRAGEALEHVLLETARNGFAASPLTQVVEVAATRQQLRRQLTLDVHPDVLLRVGRAPATPATRRRLMSDVLTQRIRGW